MRIPSFSRKWLFIPAIAVGIVVFVIMVKTKSGPPVADIQEKPRAVRYIPAPELSVVPKAVGWGYVQPGQVWEAVAEVPGRIVFINKYLKKGAIIPKDDILLKIDPAQRKTAEYQADAKVKNMLAKLEELVRREANARRQLAVEKQSLEISRKELERREKLVDSGVISRSELDQERKRYLAQENAMTTHENTLNILPAERQALMAEIAAARSKLEDARLDLEKTVIRAPFDCRISHVEVELGQAVKTGELLATADSMGVSETMAQIPLHAMRKILPTLPDNVSLISPEGKLDMDKILKRMGLTAVVRLEGEDGPVEWKARVARISEEVDPKTRSMGIYVAVDNPYDQFSGSTRPPLIRNMYGQVEIQGMPRAPHVVIPRSALHNDVVYIVGPDSRLKRKTITSDYKTGRLVSVTSGIEKGDKVIITDLIPAIEGMLLEPKEDKQALEILTAEAQGENPVK